ncbi:ABC transporter permease [Cohnella nanjingensis]|uniref:ABC transporter permease n=1 Tax=Cohnella nanjingensis TaxID=1387779 RepID=UPI001FE79FD5|nr:ABC transporter permease subunit [Cohnella nanjingensis]
MYASRRKNSILKDFIRNFELTFLALPAIVFIFVFAYIPLYGLILPFKNYNFEQGFFGSPWAGLQNFKYLFTSDTLVRVTTNTVVMNALFILFGTLFSLLFALLIFEVGKRHVKVYQTAMFFPYFISWVVAAYVVLAFLDMENGFINRMLIHFGKDPIMWYSNPHYWPFILVIVSVWKSAGYGAVIYYTGLLGTDTEYYEAAMIDGATRLQRAWHISLPLLKPLITIMTILAVGKIFYGDFGLFYNVTLDSTQLYPATDVIDTFVYRTLKSMGDIGMSSAAGLYQAVVGFALVLLSNWVVKKANPENSLF